MGRINVRLYVLTQSTRPIASYRADHPPASGDLIVLADQSYLVLRRAQHFVENFEVEGGKSEEWRLLVQIWVPEPEKTPIE